MLDFDQPLRLQNPHRVYGAAEELRKRGLVTVDDSTPKRFYPVSVKTANRTIEREFLSRVDDLTDALEPMEPSSPERDEGSVETLVGNEDITAELRGLIASADDEVMYVSGEIAPTEAELADLRAAVERGVHVMLVGVGDAESAVPGAEVVDFAPVGEGARLGRLTIADGETALVSAPSIDAETTYLSALSDGDPAMATEHAVLGRGKESGLLCVAMALVADRS